MSESQQQSKNDVGTEESGNQRQNPADTRRPSRNERRLARSQQQEPSRQQKQQPENDSQETTRKVIQRHRRNGKDQIQQEDEKPRRLSLAEMFREENDSVDDGEQDDVSKPPKDIKRAMKRLNLKQEQFDEILVDIEGQNPVPFKTLRSRVGELLDLETNQVRFEDHRIRTEGELMRSREELRAVMALIPPDRITPQLLEKVRTNHAQMTARERQSTLDVIPAWKDEKIMERDTTGMKKFVGNWGFDSNWLDQITDHRAIKFIRDMYLRDLKIQAKLAEVTTPEDSSKRGSGKTTAKGTPKPQEERQGTRRSRAPTPNDRLRSMFRRN